MSRTSLLDEPADIHAEIGSPVWSRGVARAIECQSKQLDTDVAVLKDWIRIARENEAWKSLGYISLDTFLLKESKFSLETLDAILKAKDGKTLREIIEPLAEHGGDRKSESKDQVGNANLIANTVDYTLRRLARDNPELLDRIEAGELSVNAAAIKAGFRKKATHAEICVKAFKKTDCRLSVLKAIATTLEPHEWEYLIDLRSE